MIIGKPARTDTTGRTTSVSFARKPALTFRAVSCGEKAQNCCTRKPSRLRWRGCLVLTVLRCFSPCVSSFSVRNASASTTPPSVRSAAGSAATAARLSLSSNRRGTKLAWFVVHPCGAARGDDHADRCAYCHSSFTLHERDLNTVCPHCLALVSDRARFCHHCGTGLAPNSMLAARPT